MQNYDLIFHHLNVDLMINHSCLGMQNVLTISLKYLMTILP